MKTVLIYRLGSLGDTIVALPCFHKIADCFPDARRIVLTNKPISQIAPRLGDILQASGLIHSTIEYRVGTRSARELVQLWKVISGLNADHAVYLTDPRGRAVVYRDLAFFRACGIRNMLGVPNSPDLLLNRIDPATGEDEYESERLARCLSGLGPIDLQSRSSWDLRLTASETSVAEGHVSALNGDAFIAFNMGGKQAQNDWGAENWSRLLAAIAQRAPDRPFVFVGAEQDRGRAEAVMSGSAHRVLNLCGKLAPRETAAVLTRARLFVGHDSGPMHLASACDVTCFGLYGSHSKPHRWYPFGAKHRIFLFDHRTPDSLVDVVQDAILEAIH